MRLVIRLVLPFDDAEQAVEPSKVLAAVPKA